MSAIHHDSSPDLRVVGSKLKDILEVLHSRITLACLAFTLIFITFFSIFFSLGSVIKVKTRKR